MCPSPARRKRPLACVLLRKASSSFGSGALSFLARYRLPMSLPSSLPGETISGNRCRPLYLCMGPVWAAVDCGTVDDLYMFFYICRGPLHVHRIVTAVCRGSTVYISLHHDVESTSLHHSTVYIPLHSPSGFLLLRMWLRSSSSAPDIIATH